MAKKTQTELLEGILLLLDQSLGEIKKKNKETGVSNAPKGAGIVNAKDISVKAVGDALSVISSAVPKLAKISEKQYDTVAKGIENLATAISSFKMDKDSLAAIGNIVSAFNQIHNVISGMSENFIKSILSLNPIKAWVLGKRLGNFYGILAQGMVSTFVKQIVDIINQVPPNKNVHSKTFKERLVNFGLMMTALLQIKEKQIMQLWMMGVFLGPKIGAAIGGFFKELIDKLAGGKNSVEKANAATKVALSLVALVGTLTLSLIALVILQKSNDIKDVLGGFGLLTLVVAFALGIIKLLGSKWFKREKNEGLQGTKDILLLIGGLTLSIIALVLVAKKTKWSDVVQGITMLSTITTFAIGILLVLGKESFKKNVSDGLKSLDKIMLLIGGLTLLAVALVLVAKKTKWTDVVQGTMMLTTIITFTTGILLVLGKESFKKNVLDGLKSLDKIMLLIGGLTLSLTILVLVAKKTKWTDVVQGTMMLTSIMAFAMGILLVLGKRNFKKNVSDGLKSLEKITLLIGGLTLAIAIVTYVAKKTKWTDVVQGIMMLGAVVAFALGIIKLLNSKWFKQEKNEGQHGIKDILLLIGGLTLSAIALVLVAKKTKLTDVVQGIMMLTSIMAFALGIIKLLGSKWFKQEKNNGLQGTKDILLLIGGLTLSLTILVLVAKKTKWTDVVQGIVMLGAVVAFATGILLVLGKESFKKNASDGLKSLEKITLLIGGLTLSAIVLVLVAKKTKLTDVVQGIVMLGAVVAFALGIIKLLNSKWFKQEKNNGLQGTKDIILLIGGLTLTLAIVTYIAKKTKLTDVVQGILLLTVVMSFAIGILLVLGKESFKKNASDGLKSLGKISLLILGMTISLAIVTYVAKKTKWQDMVQGIMMLGAVVAFALGLIWVLSRESFQKNATKGLVGVGAIILLIAGVSAAMLIFAEYVKKIDGVKKESAWRAFGLMQAVIGGMAALAIVIGAIWSTGIGAGVFAAAFIGVEMIAAMIASVSDAILLFVELIEKTKALSKADISTAYDRIIGNGTNDTESLVGCLVSIVNAIDENIRWKAAPKIAAIGLAIRPLISSISQFVDIIQKMASMQIADQWDKNGNPIHYLKLSPSKFKDAAKNLTDAFSTFLKDLSEGLKGFDTTSLAIIQLLFPRQSGLSKLLTGEKPGIGLVIKTLSDFIDVIQKMASMSVPDKWDKDGRPISYKKLDPEKDFKSAAINLSSAFSTFISELGKGLEDVSIKSAIVLKLLGGDISGVLQSIGSAFNPIIQIAAGKMQIGNQTVDITLPKLKQAAKDVVKVISTIITDLSAIKDKIDFDDFEGSFACVDRIIEMIGKIATSEAAKEDFPKKIKEMLIPGICGIFNFLQSTEYINKADSNANSFKDVIEDFVDGVKELEKIQMNLFNKEFIDYSTNLVNGLNEIVKYLNDTNFKTAKTQSSVFTDIMKNTAAGIKELERIQMNLFNKEFIDYSTNLVNGLNEIFNFLQSTKYLANAKSNSVVFKDIMKNTSAGINHIKPFLSSTPKQIVDLANAMKQLDAELITKEEQRTKAIQSVASNFKDMAEGVNQLNKAMAESMRLTRLYDQMKSVTSGNIIAKGVSAAVEGAGAVASKVKEALNDNNKNEEQQKAKEETKQKDREELAAIIGNAVSAALTAWSESHRDLTVQFSDSPEKIFGEVYHN